MADTPYVDQVEVRGTTYEIRVRYEESLHEILEPRSLSDVPVASFEAPGAFPLKDMLVNIEPVQSGSGDPSPTNIRTISGWTGCTLYRYGKNLFNKADINNNKYVKDDGSLATISGGFVSVYIPVKPNQKYRISKVFNSSGTTRYAAFYREQNAGSFVSSTILTYTGQAFTVPENANYFRFSSVNGLLDSIMLTIGEGEQGEYEAYHGFAFPISWQAEAGTVYGGTLNPITGELKARPYYASYNGETLVGPWVSSMDVYAEGTTPTTGAQVVDLGGTETVYQLTPVEIKTLLGQNNIWADTGDVSVTYGAYLEAVSDQVTRVDNKPLAPMSAIAPIEDGDTCANANGYAAGEYFFRNGAFCVAIGSGISSGGTFTLDTNYEVTTVAAVLTALAQ